MEFRRNIENNMLEALSDTPVLLLAGARQAGKSTLIKSIIQQQYPAKYTTLDDSTSLAAANADPLAFLKAFNGPIVIDEVQRAPSLFLSIKQLVDEHRQAGRFILTGSANVLTLPKVADSLAGRIEIQTLWPLSQGEINNHQENFIDTLFTDEIPNTVSTVEWDTLLQKIITGGFPEVVLRVNPNRRLQWFQSYLTSLVQRDIRELANIEGLTNIPNLLSLLANRSANLLNTADISRISGISNTTLKRYLSLLENIYLIVLLPAWHINHEKRIVKTKKIYFNDTGLLCYLRKMDLNGLKSDPTTTGAILENFVVMELMKQQAWSTQKPNIYHFRNHAGHEVDIVLESMNGKIVGVEVKSNAQVKSNDFKGMKTLAALSGEKFHRGIILYRGDKTVAFGENLYAVPLSRVWGPVKSKN